MDETKYSDDNLLKFCSLGNRISLGRTRRDVNIVKDKLMSDMSIFTLRQ